MNCPNCNTDNNEISKFCKKCGSPLRPVDKKPEKVVNKNNKLSIMIGTVVVLLIAVGILLLFLLTGGKGKKYEELVFLGDRSVDELDFNKAEAAYREAIDIDPKCSEAYIGLSRVYEEMGDYEAVVEILEEGYIKTEDRTVKRKLDKARNTIAKSDLQKKATPTPALTPTSAPTPTEPEEELYEDNEPTVGDVSSDDFLQASAMLDLTAKKKYREAIEKELEGLGTDDYSFCFIYLDGDDSPEVAMFCSWWSSVFWYDGDDVEIASGSPVSALYYIPYTGRLLYEESVAEYIDITIIVNKKGKDTLPVSSGTGNVMRGDKVFEAIASGDKYTLNGKTVSNDEFERQVNLEKGDMIHLRADEDWGHIEETFVGKTLPKEKFMRYLE